MKKTATNKNSLANLLASSSAGERQQLRSYQKLVEEIEVFNNREINGLAVTDDRVSLAAIIDISDRVPRHSGIYCERRPFVGLVASIGRDKNCVVKTISCLLSILTQGRQKAPLLKSLRRRA